MLRSKTAITQKASGLFMVHCRKSVKPVGKKKKCSQKYFIPELQSFDISFASCSLSSSSVVGVLETYTNHKHQIT